MVKCMVRLLTVTDIHGSSHGLDTIHKLIAEHEPDIVIVCGDITHFGPVEWARKFLESIKLPLLTVNGNCDIEDVEDVISARQDNNLINRSVNMTGLTFVGLGYPPDPHYKASEIKEVDVLVSHVPPQGCNDRISGGNSIGDHFVREMVLNKSPRLVLSGHVHEARGICRLSDSICVNPGPAQEGFGAVIDIGEEVEARLVDCEP
jgi:Icc-related predicted phosphoesterase